MCLDDSHASKVLYYFPTFEGPPARVYGYARCLIDHCV
eukprot:SAG11_NODE_37050_length_258_cov_1.358491_1_plen_37_part_01